MNETLPSYQRNEFENEKVCITIGCHLLRLATASGSGWSVSSPLSSMTLGLNLAFLGDQPQNVDLSQNLVELELFVLFRPRPVLMFSHKRSLMLFSLAGESEVEPVELLRRRLDF